MQVGVYDDGQICQFDGCMEMDLLPAVCTNCHRTFCSQHILSSSHHCQCMPDARLPHCPICNAVVMAGPGQSIDEAVGQHMDRGCTPAPVEAPTSGSHPLFNPANPWLVGAGRRGSSSTVPIPPYRRPTSGSAPRETPWTRTSGSSLSRGGGLKKPSARRSAYATLSSLLRTKPGNSVSTAIGRPLGVAVEKSTDAWIPLVYTLVCKKDMTEEQQHWQGPQTPSPEQTGEGERGKGAVGGTGRMLSAQETQDYTSQAKTSASASSDRHHGTTESVYLAVPPLYVYAKRTHSLGKVLDTTVEEVRLHHSAFSAASASAALSPRYLFLVPLLPPDGVTVEMFPPQPLSGLVSKTVWGSGAPAPGDSATSSTGGRTVNQAVVFLSNRDKLPPELLTVLRHQQSVATASSCLTM